MQPVLDCLEGLPAHISFDDSLAQAAFLVLLCTGWRTSELQACVKLSEYCLITLEGKLRIRPHEAFLAKNELSHSGWPHSYIEPLFNPDGSRSKLCPVNNMHLYLNCSEPTSAGPLFTSRSAPPSPSLCCLDSFAVLSLKLFLTQKLRFTTYEGSLLLSLLCNAWTLRDC